MKIVHEKPAEKFVKAGSLKTGDMYAHEPQTHLCDVQIVVGTVGELKRFIRHRVNAMDDSELITLSLSQDGDSSAGWDFAATKVIPLDATLTIKKRA